jgi:hypothetical protein
MAGRKIQKKHLTGGYRDLGDVVGYVELRL